MDLKEPLPLALLVCRKDAIKKQIKDFMGHSFQIIESEKQEEILTLLSEQAVDFILLDQYDDPEFGLSLCKFIKKHKRFTHLPIILIADKYDSAFTKEALNQGITNFLYTPFTSHTLHSTIAVEKHYKEILLELTTFSQKLKKLAEHDPLTNFYNRYVLYDHGRKEIDRALRGPLPLSLLMIDIDHFKEVNDLYGHLVGDEVLVQLADCISKTQRSYDLTVRFGGEEFVLLLSNTPEHKATIVAEKIRQNVEKTPFVTTKGIIHLTISIGVAELSSARPRLELLLQDADEALYNAKLLGRNQVQVAHS